MSYHSFYVMILSNWVVELHSSNGDTPTLRLEQSGASGFTPYTWDVAANETNFFIRDVNGGSKLPFRVRPNAGTSSIDMYADRLELGVATTTPEVRIGKGGRVRVDTQVLVGFTDPSNAAANTIFEVGTDFDVDGDDDQESGGAGHHGYIGSEPLDPALADRFAFVVEMPDWAMPTDF